MPLYIIIGSVMDYYKIDPRNALCAILGIVGWQRNCPYGMQILSLREQEFMVLQFVFHVFSVRIPNVIPHEFCNNGTWWLHGA